MLLAMTTASYEIGALLSVVRNDTFIFTLINKKDT